VAERLERAALLELLPLAAISLAVRSRQDLPPGRCRHCKDRPDRLPVFDPWTPPHSPPPTDAELAPCEACGWAPFYIAVNHTDELTGRTYTEWEYYEEQVLPLFERLAHGGTWQAEIERERERQS
jgi:hypothetical protein